MSNQMPNKYNYRFSGYEKSRNLLDDKYINSRINKLEKVIKNGNPKKGFNMFMRDEYITEADDISTKYANTYNYTELYNYLKSVAKNDLDLDVYDIIGEITKNGSDYFANLNTDLMDKKLVSKLAKQADILKDDLKSKSKGDIPKKDAIYGMFDTLNVMDKTNTISNDDFVKSTMKLLTKSLNQVPKPQEITEMINIISDKNFFKNTRYNTKYGKQNSPFNAKILPLISHNKDFKEGLRKLRQDFLNTPESYKLMLNMDRFNFAKDNNFSFLTMYTEIVENSDYNKNTMVEVFKDIKTADKDLISIFETQAKNVSFKNTAFTDGESLSESIINKVKMVIDLEDKLNHETIISGIKMMIGKADIKKLQKVDENIEKIIEKFEKVIENKIEVVISQEDADLVTSEMFNMD